MNEKWGEMEQKGVKRHDRLPCVCLYQAAGATDVPTQGFTQDSDEIKELTATSMQRTHDSFPLHMANTLRYISD